MAIGSSFAAMNTMYAAVARRAREIGTLRVLGFSRGSILFSFFLESVLWSGLGGVLGCLLVMPLNGRTTGIGSSNFAELAFDFRVTPQIMLTGMLFAVVLGRRRRILPGAHGAEERDSHRLARSVRTYGSRNSKICESIAAKRRSAGPPNGPGRWIVAGGGPAVVPRRAGASHVSARLNTAPVVETVRVQAISAASAPEGMVLNATGYIVAAHKIEVAAKVIGKVNWIGVEKGDHVKEGQVLVRLEDDEYQAQLTAGQRPACQSAGQAGRSAARIATRRNRPGAGQSRLRQGRSGEMPA